MRERHQGLLKHKLEHLKTQIQGDNDNVDAVRSAERGCDSPKLIPHEQLEAQVEEDNDDDDDDDHHDDHDDDDDDAVSSANAAERVCYSPKLIPYEDLDEVSIVLELTNTELTPRFMLIEQNYAHKCRRRPLSAGCSLLMPSCVLIYLV